MPAHLYIHHPNVRRSDDPMNHASYNVHSTQRLEAAYEHSTPPSLDDSPSLDNIPSLDSSPSFDHWQCAVPLGTSAITSTTADLDLSQDQHSFFWQNQPHVGPQEPKLRRHHQDVHEKPPKGATPCKGYYMCTCGEHWSTSRKREILIHLEEIKEDSEHLLEHFHIKGCMNGVTPGRPRCDSSTVPQRSMSVPPLVS
ncbi:hypothetical protein PG990_001359 [Apiospora arundinis]